MTAMFELSPDEWTAVPGATVRSVPEVIVVQEEHADGHQSSVGESVGLFHRTGTQRVEEVPERDQFDAVRDDFA